MGPEPYTASEHLAADKGHYVLKFYITIIAYTQQLLVMEDLFGTSANCTVGTFIVKSCTSGSWIRAFKCG